MPQISVIVPVYRVESYLKRCIGSILAQSFSDFELILIDDGSPDKCGAICDEYAAKDPRVHVIHQENAGLSAARNAGIDWMFANSDSEWLTFVDSDDYIHPEYLARMLHAVLKENVKICVCNATQSAFTDNEEDFVPEKYETEYAYSNKDVMRHRISAWCKVFHRSLWQDIRFPVGRLHEDRFTTYKVFFQEPYIATMQAKMYWVTPNPEGISQSSWTPRRLDHLDAIEEELAFFEKNHYDMARNRTVYSAFYVFTTMIEEIRRSKESEASKKKHIRIVRNRLKDYIRRYKKALNLTVKKHSYVYEVAYPNHMKLYCLMVASWNCCKRMITRNR